MTSPADGRVVSELRGLSAWLATCSQEARRLLIGADPVGVGLYGDIGGFTKADKMSLLGSLDAFAAQGPLRDHPEVGDHDAAWAFRSLASADMASAIHTVLEGQGRCFLLRPARGVPVRSAGSGGQGSGLPRHPRPRPVCHHPGPGEVSVGEGVRLDAYLNVAPAGETKTLALKGMLEESRSLTFSDAYDQLRGTLLDSLYPDDLRPAEVWRHAARRNPDFSGRFLRFWNHDLANRSSPPQIAELMDALHLDAAETFTLLQESRLQGVPIRLLARALERLGDEVEVDRLYNWVNVAAIPVGRPHAQSEDGEDVRDWLEARPDIQKGLVRRWLETNDHASEFTSYRRHFDTLLHGSGLPADFGLWCLEQAADTATNDLGLARRFVGAAYQSLRDPAISEGLTLDIMRDRLHGHGELARGLLQIHLRFHFS